MKTLQLMLSAAFLLGVSAFPRTLIVEERPADELFLVLHGQMIALPTRGLTVGDNPQQTNHEIAHGLEDGVRYLEEHDKDLSEDPTPVVRSRRSTQPGGNAPQWGGDQRGGGDRGGVDVGVSRSEGGGRRVEARGEGNVWQSRDGRGRVDVHGHYSRDYGGRYGTGRPQYGGGIRYSHRF